MFASTFNGEGEGGREGGGGGEGGEIGTRAGSNDPKEFPTLRMGGTIYSTSKRNPRT